MSIAGFRLTTSPRKTEPSTSCRSPARVRGNGSSTNRFRIPTIAWDISGRKPGFRWLLVPDRLRSFPASRSTDRGRTQPPRCDGRIPYSTRRKSSSMPTAPSRDWKSRFLKKAVESGREHHDEAHPRPLRQRNGKHQGDGDARGGGGRTLGR